MRDIKFRAFNGDRIVKVNTIRWTDGEIDWVDTSKNDDFDQDLILMQYTGMKDVKGVEIYEHSELDGAYEVIFKDMRYSLRHIRDNDIIDLHDYWRGKNGEIEVTREYTKV